MKKAEIKELTDMVMNANCERTKHNDGFILTCKNNEGFSSRMEIYDVSSDEEAKRMLLKNFLSVARSCDVKTSIPKRILDKDCINGQKHLLWWKDHIDMTKVILDMAKKKLAFNKKYRNMGYWERSNSKEYNREKAKLDKQEAKLEIRNYDIILLADKRQTVPISWL